MDKVIHISETVGNQRGHGAKVAAGLLIQGRIDVSCSVNMRVIMNERLLTSSHQRSIDYYYLLDMYSTSCILALGY